ncbi:MAG: hypothetical protein LBU37_03760 [Tannerellaceae bacterium]|nr:hypothetical protein [Tannerellaceae bacterium]
MKRQKKKARGFQPLAVNQLWVCDWTWPFGFTVIDHYIQVNPTVLWMAW